MGSDDSSMSRIFLTIYVFRGDTDTWYNRHVLAYWTSPDDPTLFRTVQARRMTDPENPENPTAPWQVETEDAEISWALDTTYLSHVNAGMVQVPEGQETLPVDIMVSVSVEDREQQTDWNGQHFVFEGLQKIVDKDLQSREWYEWVESQLMDKLMDGAVP